MPIKIFDKESIKQSIEGKLQRYNGRTIREATAQQIYNAVASTVRDQIMQRWMAAREERKLNENKRLFYLSVEFLTGRSLYANMLNLCATDAYQEALNELGVDLNGLLKEEPEPGLGNGGLGRLASCFLDSLSTLNLPAMGCTIRYEYGLFKQKIMDGQQVELPDNWLANGNVWEMPVMEDVCEVHFGGTVEEVAGDRFRVEHKDFYTVEAIPYDMPVAGYDTENVNPLRMWSARSPKRIDLINFGRGEYVKATEETLLAEVISKVLYPEDNHYEGRLLRLKQHYFLASATVQYIIKDFKRAYGTAFHLLPEKVVIHINDTHPGLAIPELMRILMDEEGLSWEEAEHITVHTMAYTNHTIMSEALERWPEEMVRQQLPRIYMILQEINQRLCEKLWERFPGEWDRIAGMAVLSYNQVQMTNLLIAMSFSVNGVSALHGDILMNDTFKDYCLYSPGKFSYITNGVTHRRWLMACNRSLAALISETIGNQWQTQPTQLEKLLPYADDPSFRDAFYRIKQENKRRLSQEVLKRQGILTNPDFLFDVQAKRLHEYKRQLLNALHILVLYNRIDRDPSFSMVPRVFFFGAKAPPGYQRAKQIIRFINALSRLIAAHPRASRFIQVVFLENYDVSLAEILMPAADVSEQLSTASKEASGTGNMKFMLNGAVTIGTMDGANVEMFERVGDENIYIFGMRADTVRDMYREGAYNPMTIYESNLEIRAALTQLINGALLLEQPAAFQDIYHTLLLGESGGMADPYMVLKDFGSYSMAQRRLDMDFRDRGAWLKKAVVNTAMSGYFSSDRSIAEYNQKIWHLTPLENETESPARADIGI
ncbi:MAG: glycogen/starch/alpha-glucan phosphorylase [Clostridia bacterium]|nr:glycogen/starch/alpha-glucan phosphorylase [Clostridia bacterium]